MIEVWGHDSKIKGLRLIRFRRERNGLLRWLGEVGEEDVDASHQFCYFDSELISNKWQFIE